MSTPPEAVILRRRLIRWWGQHGRDFPWRKERDPYRVLLAELMLHRTRANQVSGIYRQFVNRYQNVLVLARARPSTISRALAPLGLRWRTRLLCQLVREVAERHGGVVPTRTEVLRALPGVGDYVAGAVACFAYNRPEPLLDTNIVRVLARLFGLSATDSSRRSAKFRELVGGLVDPARPREFYFGLIDLASLICVPRTPHCHECPLESLCTFARGSRHA